MALDKLNFEEVTEDDLDELVTSGVPEGPLLDYKRDLYGGTDDDKREALKDISSFANSFGGHLVIGIEEATGAAVKVTGIASIDPDKEILRLDQLARSAIEPRIQGLRLRAVPLKSGAHCIIVRVPRSWRPPHRVTLKNSNRFYVRNSGGVHEASVEELRTMFTQGADAVEKVRAFTDKRAETIDKRPLTKPLRMRGRALLHVVPLAGITGQYQLDISAIQRHWPDIRPLYGGATRQRFNLEGLLVEGERNGEHLNGYLQVFRTGAIETVRASLHDKEDGKTVIWGNSLEARVGEAIPHYMEGLKALGVPPPFAIMLTLDGLNGTVIRVGARDVSGTESIQHEPVVTLPDVMIPDYGATADYTRALRPIFDAIWNMAGKARARTFDDAGNWRPRE